MRRAIRCIVWALLATVGSTAMASAQTNAMKSINGIGLIDYGHPPRFKTGQWVKYHLTSKAETGASDDYTVTVAIVGEERFWGEDGFWVETLTEYPGRPSSIVATLMSFDIFKDPDPVRNMQMYQRKLVTGLDDNNLPEVQLMKRPPESIRMRNKHMGTAHLYFDTLGVDTAMVPGGSFDVRKIRIRQGSSTTADTGDSTRYDEMRETRVTYQTVRVPITGLAREDIDYFLERTNWLIGRSGTGQKVTVEHSRGRANLIAMGDGYKSALLPLEWQHDLPGAATPKAAAPPAATPPKRSTAARR